MKKRVAILGGGVAGLSAAHELSARGYEVAVYELRDDVGGKAQSQALAGTGTAGRRDLPGEHGFRFFPAFYKHVIRTMEEIPLDPSRTDGRVVADLLIAADEAGVAPADGGGVRKLLRRKPKGYLDIAATLRLFFADLEFDPLDMGRFGKKMLRYFAACRERRDEEIERKSWWKYIEGDRYSPSFQRYATAVPRVMVAMDARAGNARTIGNISMQLLQDFGRDGAGNDRVLAGPTTEVWLAPWKAHLERRGVTFRTGCGVRSLDFDARARRITGARIGRESEPITAEHYVLAVPLEVAVDLVTDEMARFDEVSKLAVIRERRLTDTRDVVGEDEMKMVDWMVGIQFYLREDVPLVRGHIFYPDSPWALSSILQGQFWALSGRATRSTYGDGSVGGVLSVDVSSWNREGTVIRRPAKHCTAEEIATEIWAQLKAGINADSAPVLTDDLLERWHLDREIVFPDGAPDRPINRSPLLVHPPGSWRLRPTARTGIENLVLAADYVQTETDLATMEGANEAARRAVNAILDRDGAPGPRVDVWPLTEDPIFDRAKAIDSLAYNAHRSDAVATVERLWEDDPDKRVDLEEVERLQQELMRL